MSVLNLLTIEQQEKIYNWLVNEVNPIAIEEQKEQIKPSDLSYYLAKSEWDQGFPYTGSIGGGLTYMFTPTSLGEVIEVKHILTGKVLNLTDYSSW